jgi:hypothetical protein
MKCQKKITEVNESVAENTEGEKLKRENEGQALLAFGKSVLKVLTSATFIRGVFGVLTKIFKSNAIKSKYEK